MHLQLPSKINAGGLLPFLAQLSAVGEATEVQLDFNGLRRVSPGALVALVATVTRWLLQRREVSFLNLDRCAITGYLQRMDVLKACGADLPENFRRHDARGRFMPVQLVDHDVDRMGDEMACCLAPGGEDYEHPLAAPHNLAWYVFTKTANIARPHSRGFDYAKLVVDTRASMQQLEASKGKDADARARVMANWDRVEEMKKTFPEFSINWSAIFRAPEPGKDSKRVMGLHPDAPLSGRVLKELREAGLE